MQARVCPSRERSRECSWLYAGNSGVSDATGLEPQAVKMRSVRTISRKGQRRKSLESSEAIRQPPRTEVKIWSKPHGDVWNNLSEIPCRVSDHLPTSGAIPI